MGFRCLVLNTSSSRKQLGCLVRFQFMQQLLWDLVGLNHRIAKPVNKGIESLANYTYPIKGELSTR